MSKKISIGTNPRANKNVSPDDWVKQGSTASEPASKADEKQDYTRFTIDIPTDLHARIKSHCALKKVKMREEIIGLLEKHFSGN
jgi:hypothetical protein